MRREVVYRVWTVLACILSFATGAVLWQQGERLVGGLGLATALLHLAWRIDLRRCPRACVRRRAIVIPRLRPMVVSPPRRTLAHRLRARWRRHG